MAVAKNGSGESDASAQVFHRASSLEDLVEALQTQEKQTILATIDDADPGLQSELFMQYVQLVPIEK